MATEIKDRAVEGAYQSLQRDALARTEPRDEPKAIILGGQPGSGKSVLASQATAELRAHGGAVVVDADRLREEHPAYKNLQQENPRTAADLSQKAAGEWATRLTEAAADGRRNLVVDGTMRNPEQVADMASRLKEAGYQVEARVMAVPEEVSLARARLRFEEQVAERGNGRYVNEAQHNQAAAALPASVDRLERDKLVDTIKVYDASRKEIYANAPTSEHARAEPGAAAAIQAERDRPKTHDERAAQIDTLRDIQERVQHREGAKDGVTYSVTTATSTEVKHFDNARDAARAFNDAKPEDRPSVSRSESASLGDTSKTVAQTVVSNEQDGKQTHAKHVEAADPALRSAYETLQPPTAERTPQGIALDRAALEAVKDQRIGQAQNPDDHGYFRHQGEQHMVRQVRPEQYVVENEAGDRVRVIDATAQKALSDQREANAGPAAPDRTNAPQARDEQLPSDRPQLAAKIAQLENDLTKFEGSQTYQRANNFDTLPKAEALARNPELDGAYKQLQEVRQGLNSEEPGARAGAAAATRAELSEQLHRGNVPQGNVTREESKQVIDHAAAHRGVMVRDAGELKQDFQGEVVGKSSHHALVQVSDMVAVRYERGAIDKDVQVGEKVAIQHAEGKSQVYEANKAPQREQSQQMAHEMGR